MLRKKTPWFGRDVKPARVGPYERKYSNGIFYCYWDGEAWHAGVDDPGKAVRMPVTAVKNMPWRGLSMTHKGLTA